MSEEKSLYEQLGGAPAIEAAVQLFYSKVVADPRVSEFFTGVNMPRLMTKQRAFFTLALGGPNSYTGQDMRTGHSHLVRRGLKDSHFDAVVELVDQTLSELGVASDLRGKVGTLLETTRNDVLSR